MSTITAPAPPAPAEKTGTNEPVVLATYTTAGRAERVVYVQRVQGRICLTDGPPDGGRGRCYPIEDDLTSLDELKAIVADYLAQAEQRGGIPARVLW